MRSNNVFNVCLITSISGELISCFFGLIRFEQSVKKNNSSFLINSWLHRIGKNRPCWSVCCCLLKIPSSHSCGICHHTSISSPNVYFPLNCPHPSQLKPTHSVSSLSTRLPPEWPSCYRTLYLIKTAKGASITALERGFLRQRSNVHVMNPKLLVLLPPFFFHGCCCLALTRRHFWWRADPNAHTHNAKRMYIYFSIQQDFHLLCSMNVIGPHPIKYSLIHKAFIHICPFPVSLKGDYK